MLSAMATDLYENHREGAERAREAPGVPGAPGKGWSTGCLGEGGSLKTEFIEIKLKTLEKKQ